MKKIKHPENIKKVTNDEFANERKRILKDPELFENICKNELDKKIVGELETRKVIVLCAYGGRLVENCQTASFNLMVNDDAGTGKDYITGSCLELLPAQFYVKKTRISPNVLNYWHNSEDEPDWTWDGKVLYLEDISENILNHDVFKVMCSSGSSATIIKDQQVLDLEIQGKPIMIITTATATPNPELTRRFVILNLDSSIEQTKEIMKRHSEFRKKGVIPQLNTEYKEAMQFLRRVKVRIPFADIIYNHFPSKNIIMRTHYTRFLDFISASAGLHQFQRQTDEEGFLIAEGKDYDIARNCFLKLCTNKYMIPLTINQKKILTFFEKNSNIQGTVPELHNKMKFISEKSLLYNLSLLCNYGILENDLKLNAQNKEVNFYFLSGSYKPNEKMSIPSYEELCRIASEPTSPTSPTLTTSPTSPINKNDKKEGLNDNFSEVEKVEKVKKVDLGVLDLHEIQQIENDFSLKKDSDLIIKPRNFFKWRF